MKKFFIPFLHLFSLFLLLCSLVILHFAPRGRDAVSFLKEKNYLSSSDFDSAISESVNDIFDYIDLRDIFETRGTLDLNHTIAQSETNGATRSYSLDYLIKYARSMGYYLNEKNELKLRFISKESLASPEIRQLLPMITISAKEEIG